MTPPMESPATGEASSWAQQLEQLEASQLQEGQDETQMRHQSTALPQTAATTRQQHPNSVRLSLLTHPAAAPPV
jgi:hypothetical protein